VPIQPKQPTAKGPAEWFTGDDRPEADWGEHVTDDEYHNR
jgi:hypothetical protein